MHTVHSINLNDMRLTHIDQLIFVGVCGSVKAPLTHASPYSTLSTLFCTTHLQDRATNVGLVCFLDVEATWKLKPSASFSFLHRINKLKAMTKESQSIKSLRAWPSGVLGGQEEGEVQLYYCVLMCVCRAVSHLLWQWGLALPLVL